MRVYGEGYSEMTMSRGPLRAIEEEVMSEWVKAIIAAAAGGVLTLLAALATGWFSIGCPPSSPIG